MDPALNRTKLIHSLKPFTDFLLSLRDDKPIPILRDLTVLVTDTKTWNTKTGFIKRKIGRLHLRLCRIINELNCLNFKKAHPGLSSAPEDYVFSRIDFSRYREITEDGFDSFFADGITDFSDSFFRENFSLGRDEIHPLIKECYKKENGTHKLMKENPLILSVMRALEVSLETSPLFTIEEIQGELNYLQSLVGANAKMPDADKLSSLLVLSLEKASVTHEDKTITELFIPPQGGLSGIFHPAGKPWTRVLIPAEFLTWNQRPQTY